MKEVKAFRNHVERLGYSKTSVSMLPNCIQSFLEYSNKEVVQIQSADITNFYEYLQERPNKRRSGGLSESYINHHIYALRLFFSWLLENKTLCECPISSLEFKSPTSKSREILTQEEVEALYQVTESYRERAVLGLFYGCGLRRAEGVKLNLKDIHFRSNLLYVREGKGAKRRVVPLSEKVKEDLQSYALKERKAKEDELAFITNKSGTRARGNTFNKLLKEILQRSEVLSAKSEISLHSLRHSIATHLLENGLSVEYVRDFLGHKHLETTQIYTRVNKKQLWNLSKPTKEVRENL